MPFDGFNPSAVRGEPAPSAIFAGAGSAPATPTVINCGVGNIELAGLAANVAEALNINCGVGDVALEGLAADVLIPTLVECEVGDMRLEGQTLATVGILLKITISYFGRTERMPIYDKGDVARIKATFTNEVTGVEVDPGVVTFRLRKPGNVITTDTTVVSETTGTRYVDLILDTEGKWRFRWEATGGREEGEFIVAHTPMD